MYVSNIVLANYRNYQYADIRFGNGVNIIYGNNAQGKTNILESIYLFATGKSHRTNKDRELIRFGSEYANVKISFESKKRNNTGEFIFSQDQKKRVKINDIPITKIGQLMGFFNVVMFSPEDLNLVKEGPSQRRRFLDICISQIRPNYFFHLQQYVKVLEQRNNLLRSIAAKGSLIETLPIWDEKLIEFGSNIIRQRMIFIEKLKCIAKEIHSNITDGKENLEVLYIPSVQVDKNLDIQGIRENFAKKLSTVRKREIDQRITMAGPHRDDLEFIINNTAVKNYASQGQQRTVVLSLKMAEMEFMKEDLGEYPVLLLDDIMSELDKNRQNYLMERIKDRQVMITCTDVDDLKSEKSASLFRVENGIVNSR